MNVARYRFKTEQELLDEHGEDWKKHKSCMLPTSKYLFGQELSETDALQYEMYILKDSNGFNLKSEYKDSPLPKPIGWHVDDTGIVEIRK